MSRVPFAQSVCVLTAVLALSACDKVPLLAPTNSTIRLNVQLGVLPLGGSTDITAIVIESAGTPVQNGTVVTFTTRLGNVEPREARTTNGQVTVRYTAGAQSGTDKIGAFSGGAKSEEIDVLVGAAAAGSVAVRATPAFVPATGGTTEIIALVVDTGGNALRGAPVRFLTTFGDLAQSTVLTNDAGEARTQLTTNVTAEVTARVGSGTTAPEGKVTVTARDLPSLAIEITNPLGTPQTPGSAAVVEVGVPSNVKLTPSANAGIRSAVIDFGDGSVPRQLGPVPVATSIAYTYNRTGVYTITAAATDALGFIGTTSNTVAVTERGGVQLTFNCSAPVGNNTNGYITQCTATPTGFSGSIRSYEWDFGDGEPIETTTAGTIAHLFRRAGNYTVRVKVTTTTGQVGLGVFAVRAGA